MTSVGETLRRERLRKNLNLEQISRETKISGRLLEAIEKDHFEQLPGGVFAKSFVRQYARFLGLDAEELAAEVQKVIQPEPDLQHLQETPSEPSFRVPRMLEWDGGSTRTRNSPLPSLAMVVAVMLVCSAIYAWWQRSRRPAPTPQPVLATQTAPRPPAGKAAEPTEVTQAVTSPAEQPSKTDVAQSEQPPAGTAASTAPASNPAAALHLTVSADDVTWLRAWADNKEVMTVTLQPGESKTVDAADEIRVRTGNAGGLQLNVNGKPVGPAGPKGQVRIVQVTSKGVQILVPPKPVPALDPL